MSASALGLVAAAMASLHRRNDIAVYMKKPILIVLVACGVIAGALVYLKRHKSQPAPIAVAQSAPQTSELPPEKISAPGPKLSPAPETNVAVPAPVTATAPVVTNQAPDAATNSIAKTVDALLSAAAGPKHALFEELRKNGQLDAAIAELQKRAAENSNDPEIPTTLGEAFLNKIHALKDAGDSDRNDIGILAMQADQQFNAALQVDPRNWEAQFVKCASLYNWPSSDGRDGEVVQRLSSLIDEQETLSPQPQFPATYVLLGNEYMKMGRQAEAVATWQLGAQKYPADPALQEKIAGLSK